VSIETITEGCRDVESIPSEWATERFGPALAVELTRRIPLALASAVARAVDAHEASQMTTNHAFGSARWPIQYEELVRHLGDLDGAETVQPPHAFYQLVVVGGHLFLPWLYAKTPGTRMREAPLGRSFGHLAREVTTHLGPPPPWTQLALPLTHPDDEEDARQVAEIRSSLRSLDPAPKVAIVGYACNAQLGLFGVSWGEAALVEGKQLHWFHAEELAVPQDTGEKA